MEHEIQDVIDALEAHKLQYKEVLPRSKNKEVVLDWFGENFPVYISNINWEKNGKHKYTASWYYGDEAKKEIDSIAHKFDLKGKVFILWFQARKPLLYMDFNDACKIMDIITDEDMDTWILNPVDGWCIEAWHEGEINFGYSKERMPGTTFKHLIEEKRN